MAPSARNSPPFPGVMRRVRAIVACLALLVVASAIAEAAGGSSAVEALCTGATVRSAVARFIVAYDAGDLPRLDALFARDPDFRWYSSGSPGVRVQSAAYRRDTLLGYFRTRFQQRDRLRLLTFRFNGNSQGFGHFAFRLKRRALDYHGGRPFEVVGKGAAICDATAAFMADKVRFVVMSLGAPEMR